MKKNLTFKEFREELRKEYQMLGPSGYSVEEVEMEDVNGLPVASLRFTKVFGDKKSKPLNIRGAYEAYLAEMPREIILFELFKGAETFRFFSDEEYRVFPSLVCMDSLEKEDYRVNIENIPHIMFADLAVMFSIIPTASSIRIPITDIDADPVELLKIARANYKAEIIPMVGPMCAVTIGHGQSAASIFFPGVLKKTAEAIGAEERLVILPSSTKEVIVLDPVQFGFDETNNEAINALIRNFNSDPDFFGSSSEALSNHGYLYDCQSETLSILE